MGQMLPPIPLAGDPLDRLAHRRKENSWLDEVKPDAGYLLVQGSRNLVTAEDPPVPVILTEEEARQAAGQIEEPILLGEKDSAVYFALAVSMDGPQPPTDTEYRDLRLLGAQLSADQASMLAYARAITTWHRKHAFCANCGGKTNSIDAGPARLDDVVAGAHV